jgi:hypothetical protein
MNEHDETDEDAIEMSVQELQKLTDDNLNGSLQVRHKVLQLLMFAETQHHTACVIYYSEYSSYNEKFHRRVKYVHDCQSDIGENKSTAVIVLFNYLSF